MDRRTRKEKTKVMHKYLVSYTYWDKTENRQIFKAKTIKADLSGDPYDISDKILDELNISGSELPIDVSKHCITILAVSKID